MAKPIRSCSVALLLLLATSSFATEVGRETAATDTPGAQRNVVLSRDSERTLVAFEESVEGQPSRVVVHQYEAFTGRAPLGRETYAVAPSPLHQRRPAFGNHLVAWVEEDAAGTQASLWWQGLGDSLAGHNYEPVWKPERVDAVQPGTRIAVVNTHVFHVLLWTSPDGRLKAAYRSLLARIGYDPSPFPVTTEPAVNPSTGVSWSSVQPLIAYNYPIVPENCVSPCLPRYGIRARALWGMSPAPAIDIAPEGASAPRVVFTGTDFVVFWSMETGGTFAQRVSVSDDVATKIGAVQKVHDGVLHDAALGRDREYFVVVDEGPRFALLRLDRDLELVESTPFHARLAPGERISVAGDDRTRPMLAYAAQATPGSAPRAVVRAVSDNAIPQRRRSVR